MRALIIGEQERAAIDALRDAATKHVIDAEIAIKQDGDIVRQQNAVQTIYIPHGYSVTYTIERQPFGLARHLSVSIDAPGKSPHPAAVEMILEAFGMQSIKDSVSIWIEDVMSEELVINILQQLAPLEGHA